MMQDHVELFRYFMDNPDFKRWLTDQSFSEHIRRCTRGLEFTDLRAHAAPEPWVAPISVPPGLPRVDGAMGTNHMRAARQVLGY